MEIVYYIGSTNIITRIEYCHVNIRFTLIKHTMGYILLIVKGARLMITEKKISKFWAVVWGMALFSVIFAVPYRATINSRSGRDYASYHYAVKATQNYDSPYDVEVLNQLAQAEGTRKSVHPFFYPPPAILSVLWVEPLTLSQGVKGFFWFNQFCLLGTLIILRRWRRVAWSTLFAASLLLWSVLDTMKMGQINLFVGLMIVFSLRYHSGLALATAAMTKMSPALIFFGWIVQKQWRSAWVCALTCLFLSVTVLPWISFNEQIRFYTDILPEFSSGAYHGLKIPINIPANHSIPDMYNQLFPGTSKTVLSDIAKRLSSFTSGVLFVSILFWMRRLHHSESKLFAIMALIPLMLVTPVYCYEHHMALLLVPVVICLETFKTSTVSVRVVAWLILLFGGQPLFSLRWLQRNIGIGEWWFQESKFIFIVLIGCYCLWYAWKVEKESRMELG